MVTLEIDMELFGNCAWSVSYKCALVNMLQTVARSVVQCNIINECTLFHCLCSPLFVSPLDNCTETAALNNFCNTTINYSNKKKVFKKSVVSGYSAMGSNRSKVFLAHFCP